MQNWSPKDEPLTGVGGDEWRMLYEAARNYSISVAYQDKPFPNVEAGALCVYCMQPLSSEAKERLARFQSFMEQAAKRNMDSATAALKTSLKNLSDIDPDIGVTNSHKDALDEIRARDKACADNIEEYVQVALVAYSIMQSAALQRTDVSLPSIQVRPAEAIDRIAQDMEAEALRLEKVAEPSGLASLKSEKEELVARKGLNGLKSQLIQRLADLKRIAAYELCIREMDTTQITKKGRQIISAALTREFENLINKELRAFGTHIRLRLQPKGSAGETIHKLVLDGCVLPQRARVTEILSEGEQRIVSIASFLAELKACGRGNPIVFDDPVSSLDHNWRERVAKRLTEESGHRQVIVFTHDITFAAWLMQAAQDGKTLMTMRCIQRIGEKPGNASEEIPWKAAGVRESINALEQEWRRISKAWKSLEQNKYEGCARVLYSRMRATWEKVIEEVAFVGSVHRFESHIRVNPELLKVTVVDSADWKILLSAHKKCCDITEAHDNIGSCNAPVPNPDEIGADLETLQGWIKRIREKQKTLN
jgi:energy-coupling factor transporter ATP-binding protein EcfA2